jgi:chromosome segregation ATPase
LRGNTYSRQEGTFVTKLEDRVTRVEREVDEVRRLASGAHEDVSTVQAALRAHIGSLEALRKTQLEQGEEMRRGFAEVRAEFASVRGEIADVRTEMQEGLAGVRAEMQEGLAGVRAEMQEGLAGVRAEMQEGFSKINLSMSQMTALLNTAIGRDEPTD